MTWRYCHILNVTVLQTLSNISLTVPTTAADILYARNGIGDPTYLTHYSVVYCCTSTCLVFFLNNGTVQFHQ